MQGAKILPDRKKYNDLLQTFFHNEVNVKRQAHFQVTSKIITELLHSFDQKGVKITESCSICVNTLQ